MTTKIAQGFLLMFQLFPAIMAAFMAPIDVPATMSAHVFSESYKHHIHRPPRNRLAALPKLSHVVLEVYHVPQFYFPIC
jgi:hypothetical protein